MRFEDSIIKAYKTGNKVLICGNGGLASISEHFATELVGKFALDIYIPCLSLTQNTSLLTALANDFGFENVFAHQISVVGKEGDVLIAMTTSRSQNILKAVKVAKGKGLVVAVICGKASGNFDADYVFAMPYTDSGTIQDRALSFLHHVAYEVKKGIVSE